MSDSRLTEPLAGNQMQAPQPADQQPDAPLSPPSWLERLPSNDNPYAKMIRDDPASGSVSLGERARLNLHESFYKGTLLGIGRLLTLDGIARGQTPTEEYEGLTPEDATAEAAKIRLDLARHEAMPGFEGPLEGAAAFAGQLGGGMLSPESWITKIPGAEKFIGPVAKWVGGKLVTEPAQQIAERITSAALSQGLINFTTDPFVQAGSISANLQEGWNPTRSALAFPSGALVGGVLQGGGELAGHAISRIPAVVRARERAEFAPTADVIARQQLQPPQPGERAVPPRPEIEWLRVEDPSFQSFPSGERPVQISTAEEAQAIEHSRDDYRAVVGGTYSLSPEDKQTLAAVIERTVAAKGTVTFEDLPREITNKLGMDQLEGIKRHLGNPDLVLDVLRGDTSRVAPSQAAPSVPAAAEAVTGEPAATFEVARPAALIDDPLSLQRSGELTAARASQIRDELSGAAPEDLRGAPDHVDPKMWTVIADNLAKAEASREGGVSVVADQMRYLPDDGVPKNISEREATAVIARALDAEAARGGDVRSFLAEADAAYRAAGHGTPPDVAAAEAARAAVPTRGPRLVVARLMPDGTVRYGKPGEIHNDLIYADERPKPGEPWFPPSPDSMGFAEPGGPYLTREEALKFVAANEPGRAALAHEPTGLQAEKYTGAAPTGRSFRLEPATPEDVGYPHGGPGEGGKVYKIVSEDGQTGILQAHIQGDTAIIDDIFDISGGRNALGPAAIRGLLREFLADNPGVRRLSGERVSGARFDGTTVERGTGRGAAADVSALAPLEGGIAGDVARREMAAGRPEAEARAYGKLQQALFETHAARHEGRLGTAEEIYRREGPRVVAGEAGTMQPGELAQRGVTETVKPDNAIQSARTDQGQALPGRVPTGRDAPADRHTNADAIPDLATLESNERLFKNTVDAVGADPGMGHNGGPPLNSGLPRQFASVKDKAEYLIGRIVDNLRWLYDQVPPEIRDRSRLWYDGAQAIATQWADRWGKTRSQTAGMLAVLSPQKDWFMNTSMAERLGDILHLQADHRWDAAMDAQAFKFLIGETATSPENRAAYAAIKDKTLREVVAAGNPVETGMWLRAYDEAYHGPAHAIITPEGAYAGNVLTQAGDEARRAWGDFGAIGKAASIFFDGSPENISRMIGAEHKVRNFYNNIFNASDPRYVTIDTHAVAADELRPVAGNDKAVGDNFGGTGSDRSTGLKGSYALHAEAYRRLAEELGLLPREIQSITWEAVRGLFPDSWKTKANKDAIDAIWNRVGRGELSIDDARIEILATKADREALAAIHARVEAGELTPEAARIEIRTLAEAGGIDPPMWVGQTAADHVDRTSTYPAERGAPAGAQITFEVAPDPRNAALVARWGAIPRAIQDRISHSVAWATATRAMEGVGEALWGTTGRPGGPRRPVALKGELHRNNGAFRDDPNPSLSLQLDPDIAPAKAGILTRLLGYAFRQEEMLRASPTRFPGGEETGLVSVQLSRQSTPSELHEVWQQIREIKDENGNPYALGHTTGADGKMVILNNNDQAATISRQDLAKLIDEKLGGRYDIRSGSLYAERVKAGRNNYGLSGRYDARGNRGAPDQPSIRRAGNNLWREAQQHLEDQISAHEALAERDAGRGTEPGTTAEPRPGGEPGTEPGVGPSTTGPPELEQAGRGKIRLATEDEARAVITLAKTADASTFGHEIAHDWLERFVRDAAHPEASAEVKADLGILHDWLESEPGQPLTVAQHEQFATGFEQYLRSGRAPTAQLESIFAQFREWLLQIYQSITGLGDEISPEVRGFFDRMLATPEHRAAAEARLAEPGLSEAGVLGRERPAAAAAGEPAAGAPAAAGTAATEDVSGRVPVRGTPSPATTPAGAATASGEVIRTLHQQAFDLADALNFPLRQGRMAKPDFVGQYDPAQDVVRARAVTDFVTVSHEAGHALEKHVGQELTDLTNRFAAELSPLDYDPAQGRVNEGFAEFLRHYLTSAPGYAESLAPGFAPEFRTFMAERQPAIMAELDRARAAYQAYQNAPTGQKLDAIVQRTEPRTIIGTIRREGMAGTVSMVLSHAYEGIFDDKAPVARAVRDLARLYRDASGNRLNLQGADNPELLVRMFARAHQAAVGDMMDGVRPYRAIEPQGPSLRDALIKASGEPGIFGRWDDPKVKEFSNYLVARRSEVLWDKYDAGQLPRRPLAMSKDEIATAIAEAEAANPTFRDAAQMVHDYTRQLLKKQFDAGLIDRELFDKLSQEQFYVPLFRRMDDKPMAGGMPTGGAAAAEGPGTVQTIRRQTGSDRDIIDPIQGLMTQSFLVERTVAHNDIVKSLANLAEQARGSGATGVGRIVEKISATEMKAQRFDLAEGVANAARQAGIDADDVKVLLGALSDTFGDDPIMASVFRRQQTGPRGEPIVFYKEGGELRALRLIAEGEGTALYESLASLPPVMRDWAMVIGSASATAMRVGITANPVFALTNYVRDQLAAAILRPGTIPFNPMGIFRELRGDRYAQMYSYAGGVAPGAQAAGLAELRVEQSIEQLARKGWAIQRLSSIGDLVTRGNLLEGARAIGETVGVTETGTRLNVMKSVFDQKKREGLSDYDAMLEAAYQATDLLDFGRHGSRTQTIRTLIPFLNAQLQALDRARRGLFEPLYRAATGDLVTQADVVAVKNTAALGWGLIGISAALGAAYATWGAQHEAYQDANEELRATHVIIPGGAFGMPGKILLAPKPFELAIGFNLGEMLGLGLATGDPRLYGFALGGIQEVLVPPNLLNSIPILKNFAELALNKSFFTRRDIVPQRLQALQPSEQFIPGQTSTLARQIGAALNISPIKIDYAIGNTFGLWGKDVLAMSNTADPNAAAPSLENQMFFRRFIKGADVASETTKRFWDLAGQQNGQYAQANNTYAAMVRDHRDKEATEFVAALPAPERVYVTLQSSGDENGKAVFTADEKRLHPLTRAADAVLSNGAYIRELAGNTQQSIETQEQLALDPEHRRQVIDALRQLSAIEQRNALVIAGDRAYAGRKLLSAEDQFAVIRAISPEAADEIAARYAAAKIPPTETVARLWPEAQQRLMAEGSEASLRDLMYESKADGTAFEGDRTKKAPKRRISIAPGATVSPITPLPLSSPLPPPPQASPAMAPASP